MIHYQDSFPLSCSIVKDFLLSMSRIAPNDALAPSPRKAGSSTREEISFGLIPDKSSWWERYVDRSAIGGLLLSLFLHAALLLFLALIIVQPAGVGEVLFLISTSEEQGDEDVEIDTEVDLSKETGGKDDAVPESLASTLSSLKEPMHEIEEIVIDADVSNLFRLEELPNIDISTDFGGRSAATRDKLLAMFGGNVKSEQAVRNSLRWLAARQSKDGSWSFDHRRKKDKHKDHQAGSLKNCRIGATALALMTFLGAGETQKHGMYDKQVEKGLKYLVEHAVKVPEGYDLRGRNGPKNNIIPGGNYPMYAHALATIAICEAYAMTKDRRLRKVAQGAIDFIYETRNEAQGGWRYQPKQAGDLSVSGWMIMALQSGKTARLRVNRVAFLSSAQFLDATQSERGAKYAYTPGQGPRPSTTSIGLLCRMYLGWDNKNPALQNGVAYLSQTGPSPNNMYYNYYATQVMHHAGGATWPKWNLVMRDSLIKTQLKKGPEKGSWNVTDPHGNTGGRLYQTCLSAMTLEVYYRHLPLYQLRTAEK